MPWSGLGHPQHGRVQQSPILSLALDSEGEGSEAKRALQTYAPQEGVREKSNGEEETLGGWVTPSGTVLEDHVLSLLKKKSILSPKP